MTECKTNDSRGSTPNACESNAPKSSSECTLAQDLKCLATQAKKELLKDKMKAIFEAKKGKKLDTIAEVAVDAAIACMEHQLAGKEACNDYQQRLYAALTS